MERAGIKKFRRAWRQKVTFPRKSAREQRMRFLALRRKMREECIAAALEEPVIICDNPSGTIVFDTETTGLKPDEDEILQISIIDGDGRILLNSYVSPYRKSSWPKAQRVNGIGRETVLDAPYPHELIPVVRGIFESAETLIAYNNPFDLSFLAKWGVSPEGKEQVDVMLEFAEMYGEPDEKHGGFQAPAQAQGCNDVQFHGGNRNGRAHEENRDSGAGLQAATDAARSRRIFPQAKRRA